MRIQRLIIGIILAGLSACGAGLPNGADVSTGDVKSPSLMVPMGWRGAVLAVLPEARVLEYAEATDQAETTAIATGSPTDSIERFGDSSTSNVLVLAADARVPDGYEDLGAWLCDPVFLAWRSDLVSENETATDTASPLATESSSSADAATASDPWTMLAALVTDDGIARIAVTSRMARRLELSSSSDSSPASPLMEPDFSTARPGSAQALDRVLKRVVVEDPAAALAANQCESAWLDVPASVRFRQIGGRMVDRVRYREVAGTRRNLNLAVRRGDEAAHRTALILKAASATLANLGYVAAP